MRMDASGKKRRTRTFYGWIIIMVSAMGVFFSGPGQTYSISLFINAYIDGFGWSRSAISSLYSAATLCAGLTLPTVGAWVDRAGHRRAMAVAAILLSSACFFMSLVMHPIMLFIGFFMLRLFGQGAMTLIPNVLVPQWFHLYRGRALSLMSLGVVLGSAITPRVNNFFLNNYGLSGAWQFWSCMLIVIMVPSALKFVVNSPEELGLFPDGKTQDAQSVKLSGIVSDWTLDEAMRTGAFKRMLACMAVPSLVNTGVTFHMVSIVSTKGYNADFAATLLALTAMTQFPVTFLGGWLADRIPVHRLKVISFTLMAASLLLLAKELTMASLLLFACLSGFSTALDSVSSGVLWPNYFGRKNLGSIRSITMTAVVVGAAAGPLPLAFAYDYYGGYGESLVMLALLPLGAAFLSGISPAPRRAENYVME